MKIKKDVIPEGFTFSLALMDCLPVLFFSVMVAVLSLRLEHPIFATGAFLVMIAGGLKCLWKFVIVIQRRNVPFLFYQMRVMMPVGFLIMMISLFVARKSLDWGAAWDQMTSFPASICYVLGFLGMCSMILFATRLDSTDKKHNWIEQWMNAIAQFFFMLGVLL